MDLSLLAKTQAAAWHLLGQISQLSKALKVSERCGKAMYWDAQVTVLSVSEQNRALSVWECKVIVSVGSLL